MTREEEIQQAAKEYLQSEGLQCNFTEDNFAAGVYDGIIAGAQWADEHPKNPWRDAKNDPPKDGEWCLFRFTARSWTHGIYEARQMPNMAMNDYIESGEIFGWMPIPVPYTEK